MKRIIVIGSPGSGKSTFSRRLAELTGLPLHHLDMIKHRPDRTTIPSEEFDKRLKAVLQTEGWIIDGNYQRTIGLRLQYCDTVFMFDLPLDVCLSGIMARVGTKRSDLPWVEEELDEGFRQAVEDFPVRQLPLIYKMLENHDDIKIIIFKSREQADAYLAELSAEKNMPREGELK